MQYVSILPARIKTPPIVINVEFAGYIQIGLSTVTCAMFVWMNVLKESINAGLTSGMKSVVFALKTFFQAAICYPAHTWCTKHVRLQCAKMGSGLVRFAATPSMVAPPAFTTEHAIAIQEQPLISRLIKVDVLFLSPFFVSFSY